MLLVLLTGIRERGRSEENIQKNAHKHRFPEMTHLIYILTTNIKKHQNMQTPNSMLHIRNKRLNLSQLQLSATQRDGAAFLLASTRLLTTYVLNSLNIELNFRVRCLASLMDSG